MKKNAIYFLWHLSRILAILTSLRTSFSISFSCGVFSILRVCLSIWSDGGSNIYLIKSRTRGSLGPAPDCISSCRVLFTLTSYAVTNVFTRRGGFAVLGGFPVSDDFPAFGIVSVYSGRGLSPLVYHRRRMEIPRTSVTVTRKYSFRAAIGVGFRSLVFSTLMIAELRRLRPCCFY